MMTLPAFFFNFLAGIYYSKEIRTLLQKAIAPQPGLRLLDVPCGTGTLKDLCKPCAYVGGDLDTKRVLQAGLGGNANSFLTLDASQMPFADRSFDRILAAGLFHHVDDSVARKILSEFLRVLKPGGRIVVFEAIWPTNAYNLMGWLMRKTDEGKFVRNPAAYKKLFIDFFQVGSMSFPGRLGLDYLLTALSLNSEDETMKAS